MDDNLNVKRTSASNPDFIHLVSLLDNELWNELHEDQSTYEQYNKVQNLQTAVIIYNKNQPVACGCFKEYDNETVEFKRMFVEKEYRGKGISKLIFKELERWAIETGFSFSILETSIHFKTAQTLYKTSGYVVIENYDQYKFLEESICMKKQLKCNN